MSTKNSPALGYCINRQVKWILGDFQEQPGLRIRHKSSGKMDFG